MKYLIIVLLITSCSTSKLNGLSDKRNKTYSTTSEIPIPNNTTPYGTNMCKGKDFVPAYSFIVKGSEFDKRGCAKPLEAWVYDSELARWVFMDPNLVKCCNPLKGHKNLTY